MLMPVNFSNSLEIASKLTGLDLKDNKATSFRITWVW